MGNCDIETKENEERRRTLFREARRQNQYDPYSIPAVHPRYRASYHSIYPEENSETKGGLFAGLYIRLVIALCLLFAFLFFDYKDISLKGIDTSQVTETIASDITWDNINIWADEIVSESDK